jgi:hypothetical protein
MAVSLQLYVGGTEAPAPLADALLSVEVEENADRPGAMTITLPVNQTQAGALTFVDDDTFKPYTPLSAVLTAGKSSQCVFDGYVLSWRLHLDRANTGSVMRVFAQDASWLMNIDDVVREWPGVTDGEVADNIFASYGFTPAPGNSEDDSPAHLPSQHTLFQRATDLEFLYGLARRNGKICRVACGEKPGERTGYFVVPPVGGPAVAALKLTGEDSWTVEALDMDWDVMRPTRVEASQASTAGPPDTVSATSTTSGVRALAARNLTTYAGRASAMRLTATADGPELRRRTAAVLTESGWFARCAGEADLDRLGAVLRAGALVEVQGAGELHSGSWLVWRVNHLIAAESCRSRFTLVRNAIGSFAGALGGVL